MDERNPKLTRHIKPRFGTLEQITEAAESVEDLLSHRGWGVLSALIGDEADLIERTLDEGQPLTQAEYAYAHGRKSGLKAAGAFAELVISRAAAELEAQRQKHEQEPAGSGSER